MDNQVLVIIPGELFTKTELKNRLKLMKIHINPTVQDKSYFVSAYNAAIRHESNKFKIIDFLIDDTGKLYQSNKRIDLFNIWKPQFENQIINSTITNQPIKEQKQIINNNQFTLPPRQMETRENPANNNKIYQMSNSETIHNEEKEIMRDYIKPNINNNKEKVSVFSPQKLVPNLNIIHNEMQINSTEKNMNMMNVKVVNSMNNIKPQYNNTISFANSQDINYCNKTNENNNQLNKTRKESFSLKSQTIPSSTFIQDNKPKIIDKELPLKNICNTSFNTNLNNEKSLPFNSHINSLLRNDNVLRSSIVNENRDNSSFNNSGYSLIDAERNILTDRKANKQNSFQLEDALSPLLVITSIIAIMYYSFRFAKDLAQPLISINDISMKSAMRFIYHFKWLIILGILICFYFKQTNSKLSKEIFKDIKNALHQEYLNNPECLGLSQSSMISKYALKYNFSIQEFYQLILPILNDLRAKDSNIKITEEEVKGRKVLYWNWFE